MVVGDCIVEAVIKMDVIQLTQERKKIFLYSSASVDIL